MPSRSEIERTLNLFFEQQESERPTDRNFAILSDRIQSTNDRLKELLSEVYSENVTRALQQKLLNVLATGYLERDEKLHDSDLFQTNEPEQWYLNSNQVGMACYVDRFAKDIKGLQKKIPYFKELGVTFLHLLPLYQSPDGENDGGYAVSNYRAVNPELGDMEQLRFFIADCQKEGIRVVLDFIFNHTSDQHLWAEKAKLGEKKYEDFYFLYPDRSIPDRYDPQLREIFPHVRRGSFSYRKDLARWVWTTFNNYQWDLNYSNPDVLIAVVEEMLFLANTGCSVLRLDALSFIWKDENTNCESRPNAYKLIEVLNICLRIAAPSVVFKSEAIVHPDEVAKYISPEQCKLSYNPLLMGLMWSSLASQNTDLITHSLQHRFNIDEQCAWVNYIRCHDDIGWFFDQSDAESVDLDLTNHLKKLHRFYTSSSSKSFASGVSFQSDPSLEHQGLCGSLASLCGLENAVIEDDESAISMAVQRILLLHSIILSIRGLPLLYAGDELGMLNDYQYLEEPTKEKDARWVNRPIINQQAFALARQVGSPQNAIFEGLKKMIAIRAQKTAFSAPITKFIKTGNSGLFAYVRCWDRHATSQTQNFDKGMLVICNFSDLPQSVRLDSIHSANNILKPFDLISESAVIQSTNTEINLVPYQVLWIVDR
ncbi:MAG: amylosucrase [Kangiellaceae bacterium]|nr:amylosucrase [Kangiellaceae bacterium]